MNGQPDGPTLGQVAYETFTAVRYAGSLTTDWTSLSVAHKAWETTGAAVAATAIARLDTPAELSAALVENVRLRKELHERDAQLADALTPTAADFDHAADIMRLRDLHAALVNAMLRWSGRDREDVNQCASELAQILDRYPWSQPAPEPTLHALSGLIAGWRTAAGECEDAPPDDHACRAEAQTLREVISQVLAVIEQGTAAVPGHTGERRTVIHLTPELAPVEAVRVSVAEEWQPRVDEARDEADRIREHCDAEIASLTDQRDRVSDTADRLRGQVRHLRDALERCRDAAGRSPAAVHTIASQALASSRPQVIETAGTEHLAAEIAEGRQG